MVMTLVHSVLPVVALTREKGETGDLVCCSRKWVIRFTAPFLS